MNRETVYFSETIGVQPAVDSTIVTGFYKLLSGFAKLYTPHMPKCYMPTFGNCRNNSISSDIQQPWDSQGFVCISVIFSTVNARVTRGIPSLFHIITSFVHVVPISMLNNSPCHGPGTVNESRGFHRVSSPVSKRGLGSMGRKYTYQLFKATLCFHAL